MGADDLIAASQVFGGTVCICVLIIVILNHDQIYDHGCSPVSSVLGMLSVMVFTAAFVAQVAFFAHVDYLDVIFGDASCEGGAQLCAATMRARQCTPQLLAGVAQRRRRAGDFCVSVYAPMSDARRVLPRKVRRGARTQRPLRTRYSRRLECCRVDFVGFSPHRRVHRDQLHRRRLDAALLGTAATLRQHPARVVWNVQHRDGGAPLRPRKYNR